MSKPPRRVKRDLHGVLLLDKPLGLSSHAAMLHVRELFQAEKAGHTGTLDPLATGLLPICFGQATKLTAHLLDARKRYIACVRLGEATSTGDADGEIIARSNPVGITGAQLAAAALALTGCIEQIPPMYSAIKRDGVRLYELARVGTQVERTARQVQIHALSVVDFDGQTATLDVLCSKGTYIRTLAEDWARQFGQTAHLSGLRRLAVGHYGLPEAAVMFTLDDLEALGTITRLDALLLPTRTVVQDWPALTVTAEQADILHRGITILTSAAPGWVLIDRDNGAFLGLGEVLDDGRLQPRRWFGLAGA